MRMNILIAGATGKTGLHPVPTALVRECSDANALPQDVDLSKGDLTGNSDVLAMIRPLALNVWIAIRMGQPRGMADVQIIPRPHRVAASRWTFC